MSAARDVVVVGAGPWGLAAAWRTLARGASVTVLDDGRPPASDAAAGMLGPWSEALAGHDADFRLQRDALGRWPGFVAEIEEASGVDLLHERSGTLVVAGRPDEVAVVRRRADLIEGLDVAAEWLPPTALRREEPALGPGVGGGVSLPDEGQVDPRRLRTGLRRAIEARGGRIVEDRATGLRVSSGRVRGVALAGGRSIDAERIVLAAGWDAGALDDAVPLRPVKGQTLHLRAPAGEARPVGRVIRTPSVYIVPRPDGTIVVGATSEERSDLSARTGGVLALLDDAVAAIPALRETSFEGTAVGLRPATPDGAPAVGPGAVQGLVWAAGGYRHGVLLTPWAADAVADALESGDAARVPEHCRPERFGSREVACA